MEFEDTFQIFHQLDLRKAKFSILSSFHNYTNTIFQLRFCPISNFYVHKKNNLQIFKHLKMRVHSLCLWHFNDSISQDLEVIFHQYHHAVRNPNIHEPFHFTCPFKGFLRLHCAGIGKAILESLGVHESCPEVSDDHWLRCKHFDGFIGS